MGPPAGVGQQDIRDARCRFATTDGDGTRTILDVDCQFVATAEILHER
jgi:hypothetical protein